MCQLCPELDIASQGSNIEVELFFECASAEEVKQRYYGETYLSSMEVAFG